LLLIATLMFVTMGDDCDDNGGGGGIPNPGFRLICVRREGVIEYPQTGALTRGTLLQRADDASGTSDDFLAEAGNAGQADVPNAVAPAFWRLFASGGWGQCNGASTSGGLNRGVENYVFCFIGQGFGFHSQIFPTSLSTTGAAVEFMVTGVGLNTSYGMPTLQFFNEYGTLAAQTQATEMAPDNTYLKAWSGCLSGLPSGHYTVNVVNATADGVGQVVGSSSVRLYGANEPPTCNPSNILIQRCLDNGGDWDFDTCSCI
jgi:hypothetical protein